MTFSSLKDQLQDWTDIDVAGYELARCLGLMNPDVDFSGRAKGVFWSDNPIGNMLAEILRQLTENGILEYRDEPTYQHRWILQFKGTWE